MAFLPPAPVLARAAFRRVARRGSKLSPTTSPLLTCLSTSTSTSAATTAFPFARSCFKGIQKYPAPSPPHLPPPRTASQRRNSNAPHVRLLNTSSSKKTATAATFDAKDDRHHDVSATNKIQSTRKSFPETSSKSVAYWLLGSAASVFGIVVLGGLTRLTESG